ncbi:MAG: tail fiber domain-containing protein, partial [Bacteroidota bacterium]
GVPYSTYTTSTQYPLSVMTSTDQNNTLRGLSIFSTEGYHADRLNIFSDNVGLTHFESTGNNTVFRDNFYHTAATYPTSLLALQPQTGTVIIQHDYGFNSPAANLFSSADNCKMYIESGDNYLDGYPNSPCLFANHVATYGGTAVRVESTGDGSTCTNCVSSAATFLTKNNDNNYAVRCTTDVSAGGNIPVVNESGSFYANGASIRNIGMQGGAAGGASSWYNAGGYFSADGSTASNFGIYTTVGTSATNNWAAFVNGPGYILTVWTPSDSVLKQNIDTITSANNILSQLHGYNYNFDTVSHPQLNLPGGNQVGLMAHELMNVLPELVKSATHPGTSDSAGNVITQPYTYNTINYLGVIPVLVSAVNEQKETIDSLITRLTALEQTVSGCCGPSNHPNAPSPSNSGSIELENLKSMQLDQNDPNPFTEATMIHWSIPTDFKEANILFFDNSGNQINKFRIEQKGNGELQVFGSKLSAGIYNYSLIVDSKLIDSKKMMKSK